MKFLFPLPFANGLKCLILAPKRWDIFCVRNPHSEYHLLVLTSAVTAYKHTQLLPRSRRRWKAVIQTETTTARHLFRFALHFIDPTQRFDYRHHFAGDDSLLVQQPGAGCWALAVSVAESPVCSPASCTGRQTIPYTLPFYQFLFSLKAVVWWVITPYNSKVGGIEETANFCPAVVARRRRTSPPEQAGGTLPDRHIKTTCLFSQ